MSECVYSTAGMCADCGQEASPRYDNGDGKVRCESCAVAKHERDDGPKGMKILWHGESLIRFPGA